LTIQGHPDPLPCHFGHALAHAYVEGARRSGYDVSEIDVARLDFPLLRTREASRSEVVPLAIREAQAAITRADHLVLIYPVWNGGMPALVKGFLDATPF
jgi:putative NADPH-quinone reductase